MTKKCLCSLQDIEVRSGESVILKNFSFDIEEPVIMSVISEDESASILLRVIAGLCSTRGGTVEYPDFPVRRKFELSKWIQYVPDDIICYTNMKVKEFLHGVALSLPDKGTEEEGLTLCGIFHIDPEEQLLDLTYEQNRLVAMIQAIMAKPQLLLLDHPYDMIGKKAYRILIKELEKLSRAGTGIIIAADAYRDIIFSCEKYLFLREGELFANYGKEDLPHPSKVITLDNGSIKSMKPDLIKLLYRTKKRYCFLYKEENAEELAKEISLSGCRKFSVNELSMEEEVFGDYERWLQ